MSELYVSGWGDDFVVEGTVDEEAGTFTVIEDVIQSPLRPWAGRSATSRSTTSRSRRSAARRSATRRCGAGCSRQREDRGRRRVQSGHMANLIDRLREGADNIHSIGAAEARQLVAAAEGRPSGASNEPSCAACEGEQFEGSICDACGDHVELADNGDGTFRRVYHSPEQIIAMWVADDLEVQGADEGEPADPAPLIGAPSLAVAEQWDAEARAATGKPGSVDDSDQE